MGPLTPTGTVSVSGALFAFNASPHSVDRLWWVSLREFWQRRVLGTRYSSLGLPHPVLKLLQFCNPWLDQTESFVGELFKLICRDITRSNVMIDIFVSLLWAFVFLSGCRSSSTLLYGTRKIFSLTQCTAMSHLDLPSE